MEYDEIKHYVEMQLPLILQELMDLRQLCVTFNKLRFDMIKIQGDYLHDIVSRIKNSRQALEARPELPHFLNTTVVYKDDKEAAAFRIVAAQHWIDSFCIPVPGMSAEDQNGQVIAFFKKRGIDISALRHSHPSQHTSIHWTLGDLMGAINTFLDEFKPGKPAPTADEVLEQRKRVSKLKQSKLEDIASLRQAVSLLTDFVESTFRDPHGETARKLSEIRKLLGEE